MPFSAFREVPYMLIEVIEGALGLLDLLSTWRFVGCAAAGVAGMYATAYAVDVLIPRLVLCGLIFLVALWCGWRWQKSAEQRFRANAKLAKSHVDGAR